MAHHFGTMTTKVGLQRLVSHRHASHLLPSGVARLSFSLQLVAQFKLQRLQ